MHDLAEGSGDALLLMENEVFKVRRSVWEDHAENFRDLWACVAVNHDLQKHMAVLQLAVQLGSFELYLSVVKYTQM